LDVLAKKNKWKIFFLASISIYTNTLYIKVNYIFHTRVRARYGGTVNNG
jgi:hypothetical protein